MEPVKKRKESLEVQHKPFYSPSVTRKDSSIQDTTGELLPYDPLPVELCDNVIISTINAHRSQSMPDLSLPSPDIRKKIDAKASFRKTSAPVGMEAFTMRPTASLATHAKLPTILS